MIRLTLLLAFVIWLVFALGPEPSERQAEPSNEIAEPIRDTEGAITELTLESGEVWQVDRVIAPGPVEEPEIGVAPAPVAGTADQQVDDVDGNVAPAELLVLYVTGSRVNLRAGPSTDNEIVAALTQGTATEFIAQAPDGWFEIRDPISGATGFMSGDFLSPSPP